MTTTTTDHRTDYGCPPWCVRDDHWADEVGPGSPATHYGVDCGSVGVQSDLYTPEAIVYLGGEAAYCGDPAELRRVAADMLDAAAWLEEQQAAQTPSSTVDRRTFHYTASTGVAACGVRLGRDQIGNSGPGMAQVAEQYPDLACAACLDRPNRREATR